MVGPQQRPANPRYGLDLVAGVVRDNKAAGVVEPAMSKIKQIKFATEAAITILRIDDFIKINVCSYLSLYFIYSLCVCFFQALH
jgi:hypothetical protein